jgi:hypothetical protein
MGIFTLTITNPGFKYKLFPVALPSIIAPAPTPAPEAPSLIRQTTSIDSPDTLKSLVMEKVTNLGKNNYSLYALNKENNYKTFIFTKETNETYDILLPFNTWSPDNRYVLTKEPHKTFTVWDTKGEKQAANVSELFNEKYNNLTLSDITGWAAPDLLIVNTKTEDGKIGPSLWFEIASKNFIKLSTRFN